MHYERIVLFFLGFSTFATGACSSSYSVGGDAGDRTETDAADAQADDGTSDGADADGAGGTRGCASPADCGGLPCDRVPNTVGGWGFCEQAPETEAASCSDPTVDLCCSSADCTASPNGGCFFGVGRFCGGVMLQPHNTCAYDQCQSDADCTPAGCPSGTPCWGLCLPRWVDLNPRTVCLTAYCRFDSDCTAGAGGRCLPFYADCCGTPNGIDTLGCVYPGYLCATNGDCSGNDHCVWSPSGTSCAMPFCPP